MTAVAQQSTTATADLLGFAISLQRRHEARTSIDRRKERGQFFTPPSIARFMAGLFSAPSRTLRVLDAGAGTGTLSAAVCDRIVSLRSPRSIELVLFETDAAVLPLIAENMRHCRTVLHRAGHDLSYTIQHCDFVLSAQSATGQATLFGDAPQFGEFDAAIMNPPYFKLNKQSAHARAFERIIHGQPNIYALFMATAATMLRPGGELVAITPRSFCSGLYFREFRRWFLGRMALRRIHLFESRTDTFAGSDVLQESLITRFDKTPNATETIRLSTSYGADLRGAVDVVAYRTARVIDDSGGNLVIRIPAGQTDAKIMNVVESWPARFSDHGLQISTGPVVMFRASNYLLKTGDHAQAVPLILPHNVRPFDTCWPVAKNGKPLALRLCAGSAKLLVPTRNYVLLRRFSAKEEQRRLTASCLFPHNGRWPSTIAIENHVNYIYHSRRELTDAETLGLATLFNSALLDRYFRSLSGNTQVNATEIRAMPFPPLALLGELGTRVKHIDTTDRNAVEQAVLGVLRINGAIARELQESTT